MWDNTLILSLNQKQEFPVSTSDNFVQTQINKIKHAKREKSKVRLTQIFLFVLWQC